MPTSRYAVYEPPQPGLPWLAVRFFGSELYVVPADTREVAERAVAAQREVYSALGSDRPKVEALKIVKSNAEH
jgi:hypothetical protein